MLLYNIRKAKYAISLIASGVANRWNKNNEFVVYAGSSRALATLEMVVHRASIQVGTDYKIMTIDANIAEEDMYEVALDQLPRDWQSLSAYPALQRIGSEWYRNKQSLLMRVPSVIIPQEANYVINTAHPDFGDRIKIKKVEDFLWDKRLL